ncbi:MAG: hypothetical protein GOMPHAMPRED_001182 [Gomphillus americanus]|uniref:AN1-type domain-containing protein n=1 Tax=Gomphillus americanus TaxID=1940652 RepID=A0A8H3F401_9LECA|nr:MAG: hypothetical protein GOMPHAMPRED_001182 [Gomphillus americanus]
MANTTAKTAPLESYTMLPDTDLEAIGAHCHYTYCNQLDFLPFRCESCKQTYCLDHRTETAHICPKAGSWAAAKRASNISTSNNNNNTPLPQKPTLSTARQCSHPQCKTFINTSTTIGVACQTCNRTYCLKHRLKEEHLCSTLTPLGARSATGGGGGGLSQAQKALARFKAWSKSTAVSAIQTPEIRRPTNSKAAAQQVELNNLKKTAKGDNKIPPEKRVYVHVEAESTTTTAKISKGEFFYNKEWSVGRLLDEAARGLQIENVNNRGGGEDTKLRVFHVEAGRLLEFGEKVGAGLQSGNTIVLLRGVGPAVPDLMEV